jgi:hypothetical protein
MKSPITICGREIRTQGRLLRIARIHGDKYRFLEDPKPVIEGLRKCGGHIDLFTFIQRLPENKPKYNYPMEWDNFAALPITTFDNWWTQQIDNKTRNMARRAEKKGVVIREVPFDDALVKGIQEVYNESQVRQGMQNSHYGKDFETVYREEATHLDSSIFLGAYFEDKLIGFIKLVHDETQTQAGLMNIVSMVRERDKAPTNALIAQAVRSCAERGIRYLVYANFAYGKKQRSSLTDFKENNGFQKMDVPRYYVPLTLLGRAALGLGLHHGFSQLVPEPVLERLRELRKSWYNHKLQSGMKLGRNLS